MSGLLGRTKVFPDALMHYSDGLVYDERMAAALRVLCSTVAPPKPWLYAHWTRESVR